MRPYSAANSQITKLHFRISHILSLKRLRIAVFCIFIVLLLLWSTIYFRGGFFKSGLALSRPIQWANASNINDDRSRFAYIQYATNTAYLCNSLMLFESLHRLGNQADRLLMYPAVFHLQKGQDESTESRLLRRARDRYHVKLAPIDVQHRDSGDGKPYRLPWWKYQIERDSQPHGPKALRNCWLSIKLNMNE